VHTILVFTIGASLPAKEDTLLHSLYSLCGSNPGNATPQISRVPSDDSQHLASQTVEAQGLVNDEKARSTLGGTDTAALPIQFPASPKLPDDFDGYKRMVAKGQTLPKSNHVDDSALPADASASKEMQASPGIMFLPGVVCPEIDTSGRHGLIITDIKPGSAAAASGIQVRAAHQILLPFPFS
jgi:hypothetical protein